MAEAQHCAGVNVEDRKNSFSCTQRTAVHIERRDNMDGCADERRINFKSSTSSSTHCSASPVTQTLASADEVNVLGITFISGTNQADL